MTANEAFDNYMGGLPLRERLAKSRDLRIIGNLATWNICDWRKGRVKISPQWQRKISDIVGEDIFANVDI